MCEAQSEQRSVVGLQGNRQLCMLLTSSGVHPRQSWVLILTALPSCPRQCAPSFQLMVAAAAAAAGIAASISYIVAASLRLTYTTCTSTWWRVSQYPRKKPWQVGVNHTLCPTPHIDCTSLRHAWVQQIQVQRVYPYVSMRDAVDHSIALMSFAVLVQVSYHVCYCSYRLGCQSAQC